MSTHLAVSRDEWLRARVELLDAEKDLTRRTDEIARRRRELPWVRIDGGYVFDTEAGEATLADLFHGRSQLIVYHFMYGPDWEEGCPSCSAVADGFDAATTRRAYQTIPIQPDEVLREMYLNPRRGLDSVVVKGMINLLGIYPVGTMVILDTYELALVKAANPNLEFVNRPIVRVISDPMGTLVHPGTDVDLALQEDDGRYARSIIKVTSPEKYGVRVADYFV